MKNYRYIVSLILAISVCAPKYAWPYAGLDIAVCRAEFASFVSKVDSLEDFPVEMQTFIERHIIGHLGRRFLRSSPALFRQCSRSSSCLKFPDFPNEKGLRIEWTSDISEPMVVSSESEKILRIPHGYDWKDEEARGFVNPWLIGHSLHPYTKVKGAVEERVALGESGIHLKPVQNDGVVAARATIDAGQNKFLFVAPTSTGKTVVLLEVMQEQLKRSQKKLHIVIADQNNLVDQLGEDVAKLQSAEGVPEFKILQWGGDNERSSIADLTARAEESDKPIVLVTTVQSLKAELARGNADANYHQMRNVLGTMAYDEVQHLGAPQSRGLVDELVDHEDASAFLYGTTATPIHEDVFVEEMFDGRFFLAYLDSPESFLEAGAHRQWRSSYILDQLRRGLEQGEFTGFKDTKGLYKDSELKDFFVGSTTRINSDRYPELMERLAPSIERNEFGFFSVGSTAEADELVLQLTKAFSKDGDGPKFAAYHSNMPDDQQDAVKAAINDGDLNFIVTVKKLDEGINIPRLSLYVDLNRTIGVRQFFQRVGRVLRLYPGKEEAEIVTLTQSYEHETLAALKRHDLELQRRLSSQRKGGMRKSANAEEDGADVNSFFFADDLDPEGVAKATGIDFSSFQKVLEGSGDARWGKMGETIAERAKSDLKVSSLIGYVDYSIFPKIENQTRSVIEEMTEIISTQEQGLGATVARGAFEFLKGALGGASRNKQARLLRKLKALEANFNGRNSIVKQVYEPLKGSEFPEPNLLSVLLPPHELEELERLRRRASGIGVRRLIGMVGAAIDGSSPKEIYQQALEAAYLRMGQRYNRLVLASGLIKPDVAGLAARQREALKLLRRIVKEAEANGEDVDFAEMQAALDQALLHLERINEFDLRPVGQ